jgi:hypothetical protein
MTFKLDVVFRDNDVETAPCVFNFNQLQDLHVVFGDFRGEHEWRHINDIDIRVLKSENT